MKSAKGVSLFSRYQSDKNVFPQRRKDAKLEEFGEALMKRGITRVVNGLKDE